MKNLHNLAWHSREVTCLCLQVVVARPLSRIDNLSNQKQTR